MSDPTRTIDYYFSFISLYSYIGSRAFQDLVARQQLRVVYKPMALLEVFSETGGLPVKDRTIPRRAYRILEMKRWRALRGIPLVLHPKHYPADPSRGHRMLLAALRDGQDVGGFLHNALSAVWAEERNVEDADTLLQLADAGGLDGKKLLAASDDPVLHAEADALTREAVERKVFGSPFFFWQGEAFWGQDRLDMLEAAITSGRAPLPYGDV